MRPCVASPFSVRGLEYGGAKPLFCIPLVATDLDQLLAQAKTAHALAADLIEWRADFYRDVTETGFVAALSQLRCVLGNEPIIFTLRIKTEGGAQEISQEIRKACIEAVAASSFADIIDVELCNETPFLESVMCAARENGVRTILSFHDFQATPPNAELLAAIILAQRFGADIAKIAVMPQTAHDVLRLLEVTLEARQRFPRLALCTMSMGRLGVLSRLAGFLFGSDMAFAVGQEASAPGQIPIAEARALAGKYLEYSCAD
jgi:3-dehydroquinate dehydratase-1